MHYLRVLFFAISLPLTTAAAVVVTTKELDVASGLQWSEYLDPLFVNNYESDPTLSWQYFGSTSGFLRRFPGKAFVLLLSLPLYSSFSSFFFYSPSLVHSFLLAVFTFFSRGSRFSSLRLFVFTSAELFVFSRRGGEWRVAAVACLIIIKVRSLREELFQLMSANKAVVLEVCARAFALTKVETGAIEGLLLAFELFAGAV